MEKIAETTCKKCDTAEMKKRNRERDARNAEWANHNVIQTV
jgi:hypothetical protein